MKSISTWLNRDGGFCIIKSVWRNTSRWATFKKTIIKRTDTLKCYECSEELSGTCTEKTTECPSQSYQCVVGRSLVFGGGRQISDVKTKGCTVPEQCLEYSINFGVSKTVQKNTCCSTELCNNQSPDYKSIPNGKKCFSCDKQNCTSTLNCEGDENYCIKAIVNSGGQTVTLKGCASKLMCSDQVTSLMKHFSGAQFSCCQGNYCNSASTASPILLHLLVPLFFSVFFL
ncbi:urokinase plasminogen activator surface receptor-like isoform X2 [Girardinichthys multiradiatus]|uniref:urokinase plasminogen activator surface receptor-like isoform X2 n=1 Tax=Girardinichthys multiradiatus TaxID=208333 RepID=UPI001FAB511A|nr:urokinase plasminogen activator surface receptor-like isoform X2 [Girardinichthys multiradiatus]